MRPTDFPTLFILAYLIHELCDAFLQNEWMALNKVSLKHPASWVHSGIHFLGAWLVFPFWWALLLGVTHLLIDTRVPLQKWRRFYRQTTEGPVMIPFALWQDQSAHKLVIGLIAWAVAAK